MGDLLLVIGMRNFSHTSRGGAALAAAVVAAIVVAGCGGDSGSAADDSTTTSEQATTTTVPSYDVARVRAAVNTVTDVPAGYSITQRCLAEGDPDCREGEADFNVSFGAQNEAASAFAVSVLGHADADTAAAQHSDSRALDDRYNGSFDVPPEDRGDGNATPGRRGEGTVEDVEIEGWSGYRRLSEYDMYGSDGEVINHVVEGEVMLVRGNIQVQVLVDDSEGATHEAVAATVDERVQGLVAALA